MYPRVVINLSRFETNVKLVKNHLDKIGIGIFGVSKVFCADSNLVHIFVKNNLDGIADSRIQNLKKMQNLPLKKVLLRIPMHSEIADTVKYADISLNSEISTLELLSIEALRQNKTHGVIIMLDLGDLREGYFDENDFFEAMDRAIAFEGIEVLGIGTNLTCFGAVIPKFNHMAKLIEMKHKIQSRYGISLKYISAGNSSSYYLTEQGRLPDEVNNLRIGEIFAVGRETSFGRKVEGAEEDVFVLEAEIIELKKKPSVPIGEQGIDAFGQKPVYTDKGIMSRAICAVGRQDVDIASLMPFDEKIEIIGSSSDHVILDVTQSGTKYKVGDIVKFHLKYGGILSVMTSEYVEKVYIE
ncbi:MAG: alanine/ornithine racemase family PLP-dependent enzyme [Clostridia bacterium]|nr:alanine/ornithine racemase family PLP-dependent enzyme [Clostridia bacterium]